MKKLTASILTLALAACGAETEEKTDPLLAALSGSWSTEINNCTDLNDEFTEFGYTKLTFEDERMVVTNYVYSDEECSDALYTKVNNSDLDVVNRAYLASGDFVTRISINTHTYQLTSHDSGYTEFLNNESYCDIQDSWATGVAMDTTDCLGPSSWKLIFMVEGDTLLVGDEDYMGEDGFQTALDRDAPLYKL